MPEEKTAQVTEITNEVQIRPTKKQRELLEFVREFVVQHGYGPSYREIMAGCNYTSVATVAVHVKNLIQRGHLKKNGRSARSLEVIGLDDPLKPTLKTNELKPSEEKWLLEKIDYYFQQIEHQPTIAPIDFERLSVLVEALKVLGLEAAVPPMQRRLNELKTRIVPVTGV